MISEVSWGLWIRCCRPRSRGETLRPFFTARPGRFGECTGRVLSLFEWDKVECFRGVLWTVDWVLQATLERWVDTVALFAAKPDRPGECSSGVLSV